MEREEKLTKGNAQNMRRRSASSQHGVANVAGQCHHFGLVVRGIVRAGVCAAAGLLSAVIGIAMVARRQCRVVSRASRAVVAHKSRAVVGSAILG